MTSRSWACRVEAQESATSIRNEAESSVEKLRRCSPRPIVTERMPLSRYRRDGANGALQSKTRKRWGSPDRASAGLTYSSVPERLIGAIGF